MGRASHSRHLLVSLTIALITVACDSTPPVDPGDAGTDAGPPPTCDDTPVPDPFEAGGDGHATPLAVTAGQARAGRLRAEDLPEDRTGLSTLGAGDFVLASTRGAVMIESAGASELYNRFGGGPIGVAQLEGGALVRAGDFSEMIVGLGAYLVAADTVGVIADGSDGGPAIVRAVGPLRPIDFAGDLITGIVPGNYDGYRAALDYTMEPDADTVTVTLHVDSPLPRRTRVLNLLQGFFQRYRMPLWAATTGFDSLAGENRFIAFEDEVATSWGWIAGPERDISGVADVSGVTIVGQGPIFLEPCVRNDIVVGTLVIGDRLPGVQAAAARAEGIATRTITGTVTEADGTTPAADARVHVTRMDGSHVTRVWPDPDGTFSIEVPNEAVRVSAYRRGSAVAGPVDVAMGASEADLSMPAFGLVHVVTMEGASPVPARVQVFPAGALALPDESWGEPRVTTGRLHVEFTGVEGETTVRVPAGRHRVVVSRGYEYELYDTMVDVTVGATSEVMAPLRRSVDTTGVQCADYHIHTTRSPDSEDPIDLKVSALVADGLEIAVRSDHEFVYDIQPTIVSQELERFALGITGEELTTFAWGHFGVFPMVYDGARPNGGAVPWIGRTVADVFSEVRARPEEPALIINHPRMLGRSGGFFIAAGYDPITGDVASPDFWDEAFSVVEIFNDSSFRQNRDGTVADWFGLLTHGRRVFAVGSSDSHHTYDAPVGYPRTCLELGSDDPTAITEDMVRDATNAGHGVISGGIYMTVEARDGAGPGDEVTGAGAMAQVHVVVRAAEWITAETLEVIVDGTTTETIPLAAMGADPTLRLDAMIDVPVASAGSWVVFAASSEEDMADLHPGREPFAVSNPIFFTR